MHSHETNQVKSFRKETCNQVIQLNLTSVFPANRQKILNQPSNSRTDHNISSAAHSGCTVAPWRAPLLQVDAIMLLFFHRYYEVGVVFPLVAVSIQLQAEFWSTITDSLSERHTLQFLPVGKIFMSFQELRNRVICAICIDNIINMVFLCGHGFGHNIGFYNFFIQTDSCHKQYSVILYGLLAFLFYK